MINISSYNFFALYFFFSLIFFPNIYLFLSPTDFYLNFMLGLIDRKIVLSGVLYSILNFLLLLTIVFFSSSIKGREIMQRNSNITLEEWGRILFILGFIGLFISIILNLVFGLAQTNLISQRPYWATFLGYITSPVSIVAPYLYIFLCIFADKLYKQSFLIIILLLIINGVVIGSRSTFLAFLDLFTVCAVLSRARIQIRLSYAFLFIFLAIFFSYLGHISRGGDTSSIFFLVLLRFFHNTSVLYLAMTDFKGINEILLANQPASMISHMFSFITDRVQLPSSVRLPEFWGQYPREISGHFVGYIYGWLGLSYGLFKWAGLILTLLSGYLFYLSKNFAKNATLGSFIIIYFLLTTFHEYLYNLGLDSFAEVTFKKFVYCLILYILLITMSLSFKSRVKTNNEP